MSLWNNIPIIEIAEVFNGKTPSTSEQRSLGHPVLKIKDVSDTGEFRGKFESFVDVEHANTYANKLLCEYDILILNAAHNADYVGSKNYCVQGPTIGALATGEWLVIRPNKSRLDPKFMFHWINSVETRLAIRNMVKGIHLYPKDVAQLRISLPSLSEQQQIAEILDTADTLRTKRRATLSLLDTLTQSIFLEMFGDASMNPIQINIAPLSNYLEFITSGARGWAKYYSMSGSRFIRSLDVQMNYVWNDNAVFVTTPENAEARRTRVRAGDVLLTITGSRIGRVAPVPTDLEGSNVSQHVAILRVDSKQIHPIFLSFFLSLDTGGQKQIAKAQYGQTKPGLNFEQIKQFMIPVPSMDLQKEFVKRVRSVYKIKMKEQMSLSKLDAFFTSLQYRAFNGEL